MSRRTTTRRLRWAFGLTGVAALALVGFTGYQALSARTALTAVAADFTVLGEQLADGQVDAARETLQQAQEHSEEARSSTRGPLWWLGARLPALGDDVAAVRTVASVAHGVADEVLPDVVAAGTAMRPEALRPRNGRVALAPIEEAAPRLVAADRALQTHVAEVGSLETDDLVGALQGPVQTLQDKLERAGFLSDRVSRAVRLLPPMLGAEGKRTYLVLFQTNAEIRATGGIPGSLAIMTADRGRFDLTEQGAAVDLGSYERPPIPLTAEEKDVFGSGLGIYPASSTFTPDFPRTGELVRAQWERSQGQRVDGVISADPVALSYLLRGTGPVSVPGGEQVSAGNAASLLLNGVYLREPDPVKQNDYFATVARSVFEAVSSGSGDPVEVVKGMTRAAGESRLLVWSAQEEEQALLDGTRIAGALPEPGGDEPFVGVFVNDASADKMSYYYDHTVEVTPTRCDARGRQWIDVEVTMRSTAPADAADTLPVSILGPGGFGPLGHVVNTVLVYAPAGGYIDEASLDGGEAPMAERQHEGFPVGVMTVDLAPGQTRVATYTLVSPAGTPGDARVRVTPDAQAGSPAVVQSSRCA